MEIFDICIIGAGVTGCAIAQRLAKYDIAVALVEKEADVSMGASKANSGIIHSGYFTKGPLKEKLNLRGAPMFEEVCPQIGVEYKQPGAIFCATNEEELVILKNELKLCKKRGVPVELIKGRAKIQALEPQLNDQIIAVLHFPTAGIIIPFEFVVGLAEHAVMNGLNLILEFEVGMIKKSKDLFTMYATTGNRKIQARTVINAAGVYSDRIAKMVGVNGFTITPRRGEYVLFDKNVIDFEKIIFPTPSLQSKGIVIGPTVHGNFYIGPNAHEIDNREGTGTTVTGINEIIRGAKKLVRNLPLRETITNFAGIRATANEHDFIVEATSVDQFVNAAGIDSPGLSSSLAIAERIEDILRKDCGYEFHEKSNYIATRKPQLRMNDFTENELNEKIRENPQWGQIVCRCETITEAEIVEACHAPIPCNNYDMIKRRLRPGMGRCQGGFCLPKVMKIISREQGMLYEQVTKSGSNSHVVFGRTKNLCSEIFLGDEL